jgi:hypothetical protein
MGEMEWPANADREPGDLLRSSTGTHPSFTAHPAGYLPMPPARAGNTPNRVHDLLVIAFTTTA